MVAVSDVVEEMSRQLDSIQEKASNESKQRTDTKHHVPAKSCVKKENKDRNNQLSGNAQIQHKATRMAMQSKSGKPSTLSHLKSQDQFVDIQNKSATSRVKTLQSTQISSANQPLLSPKASSDSFSIAKPQVHSEPTPQSLTSVDTPLSHDPSFAPAISSPHEALESSEAAQTHEAQNDAHEKELPVAAEHHPQQTAPMRTLTPLRYLKRRNLHAYREDGKHDIHSRRASSAPPAMMARTDVLLHEWHANHLGYIAWEHDKDVLILDEDAQYDHEYDHEYDEDHDSQHSWTDSHRSSHHDDGEDAETDTNASPDGAHDTSLEETHGSVTFVRIMKNGQMVSQGRKSPLRRTVTKGKREHKGDAEKDAEAQTMHEEKKEDEREKACMLRIEGLDANLASEMRSSLSVLLRRIGVLPQNIVLYPSVECEDEMTAIVVLHSREESERALEHCCSIGLSAKLCLNEALYHNVDVQADGSASSFLSKLSMFEKAVFLSVPMHQLGHFESTKHSSPWKAAAAVHDATLHLSPGSWRPIVPQKYTANLSRHVQRQGSQTTRSASSSPRVRSAASRRQEQGISFPSFESSDTQQGNAVNYSSPRVRSAASPRQELSTRFMSYESSGIQQGNVMYRTQGVRNAASPRQGLSASIMSYEGSGMNATYYSLGVGSAALPRKELSTSIMSYAGSGMQQMNATYYALGVGSAASPRKELSTSIMSYEGSGLQQMNAAYYSPGVSSAASPRHRSVSMRPIMSSSRGEGSSRGESSGAAVGQMRPLSMMKKNRR